MESYATLSQAVREKHPEWAHQAMRCQNRQDVYNAAPMAAKQHNWHLLKLVGNDLDGVWDAIPCLMRASIACKLARDKKEEPPPLPFQEAEAWVANDPILGYYFLPLATKLAHPTLALPLLRRCPPVLYLVPPAVLEALQ